MLETFPLKSTPNYSSNFSKICSKTLENIQKDDYISHVLDKSIYLCSSKLHL